MYRTVRRRNGEDAHQRGGEAHRIHRRADQLHPRGRPIEEQDFFAGVRFDKDRHAFTARDLFRDDRVRCLIVMQAGRQRADLPQAQRGGDQQSEDEQPEET